MRRLLVLLFVLLLSRSSSANYIFYITPVGGNSVAVGQSVTFDVYLSMSSGSASFDLQSFSTYFDVHATGQSAENALPSGIGTISVSNYLSDFGSLGANPSYQQADDIRNLIPGARPTFDFEVNAQKNSGTTPVTGTLPLFRMTMNTGSMASGDYELSFVADPSYLDSNDATNSLGFVPISGSGDPGTYDSIFSIANQTFFITAGPEPSSATLSLLPLVALLFRRKRKVD